MAGSQCECQATFRSSMNPEGELGVDWGGDDDPGQSADVIPQEPETKKQKLEIPSKDPSATCRPETTVEKEEKGLPEGKLPDRVRKTLEESKSFDEYRQKRVFRFLHVFSGPEDVLGSALKQEAERERLKCEVKSLDKLIDGNVDLGSVEQH